MPLKSEIHCPTSGNAKKVTVEDSMERLARRELRKKMKLEQNNIVITTGDDVSDVVWTQEKLDELKRTVDKIREEEMDRRIKNAHENPIIVPENIKTPEEFCEWIMNYDTTQRS